MKKKWTLGQEVRALLKKIKNPCLPFYEEKKLMQILHDVGIIASD